MAKSELTLKDFKELFVGGVPYLSFTGENCEICIESGIGCVDVAVYDLEQGLLEPKETINTPAEPSPKIVFYAHIYDTVNKFYKKWELKI